MRMSKKAWIGDSYGQVLTLQRNTLQTGWLQYDARRHGHCNKQQFSSLTPPQITNPTSTVENLRKSQAKLLP